MLGPRYGIPGIAAAFGLLFAACEVVSPVIPLTTTTTTTTTTTSLGSVDLLAQASASPAEVGPAGTFEIAVGVSNIGQIAETGVIEVLVQRHDGATVTGVSGAGWSCSIVGSDGLCTIDADVAAGAALPPIVATLVRTAAACSPASATVFAHSPGNPLFVGGGFAANPPPEYAAAFYNSMTQAPVTCI